MTTDTVKTNPHKQFLLSVDEIGLAFLSKLMPMIKYYEIEGMSIIDQPDHYLLVTPKAKIPEDANVKDAPSQE